MNPITAALRAAAASRLERGGAAVAEREASGLAVLERRQARTLSALDVLHVEREASARAARLEAAQHHAALLERKLEQQDARRAALEAAAALVSEKQAAREAARLEAEAASALEALKCASGERAGAKLTLTVELAPTAPELHDGRHALVTVEILPEHAAKLRSLGIAERRDRRTGDVGFFWLAERREHAWRPLGRCPDNAAHAVSMVCRKVALRREGVYA